MNKRIQLFALAGVALCSGCILDNEEPGDLRFAGIVSITKFTDAASGTESGGVYGRITIPELLDTPSASVAGCDYFAERARAGVSFGDLTLMLDGLDEPLVVQPRSFVDGSLYLANMKASAMHAGATVAATLAKGSVTTEVAAPESMMDLALPTAIAQSSSLPLTWRPGGGDDVEITLELRGLGREQTLRCRTDDTGAFVVPPAALALVDASTVDQALLGVARRNVAEVRAETADLALTLAVQSQVFATIPFEP